MVGWTSFLQDIQAKGGMVGNCEIYNKWKIVPFQQLYLVHVELPRQSFGQCLVPEVNLCHVLTV